MHQIRLSIGTGAIETSKVAIAPKFESFLHIVLLSHPSSEIAGLASRSEIK
ncbi:MAG: hypothetical protein MUE44_27170 [Oscillatoriaceae cyanobacterium Prado104]|jgi:hypothetical protein|nr:hypothetical protein [Oscillatoriaceae cyanobacterium Prado104]